MPRTLAALALARSEKMHDIPSREAMLRIEAWCGLVDTKGSIVLPFGVEPGTHRMASREVLAGLASDAENRGHCHTCVTRHSNSG
jgi:hypothetical protein